MKRIYILLSAFLIAFTLNSFSQTDSEIYDESASITFVRNESIERTSDNGDLLYSEPVVLVDFRLKNPDNIKSINIGFGSQERGNELGSANLKLERINEKLTYIDGDKVTELKYNRCSIHRPLEKKKIGDARFATVKLFTKDNLTKEYFLKLQ